MDFLQTYEINRGRTEGRCLVPFDVTASSICFPFAQQAARLTRCIDSDKHPAQEVKVEFLVTSRSKDVLPLHEMFSDDLGYWGIETGLHLRLDVIAGEDRSRVRHRRAVLNLAMLRRVVVSIAVCWIKRCLNSRKATMSGFYDFMNAQQNKKSFSLVTVCHSSWLPK